MITGSAFLARRVRLAQRVEAKASAAPSPQSPSLPVASSAARGVLGGNSGILLVGTRERFGKSHTRLNK